MSNTVTNLSQVLISDTILPAFKLALTPINAMSINLVADKPLYKGDKVEVDVITAKSAGTYSTTFESGDSTSAGVQVEIQAPEFSSWHINPYLEAQPTAERFLALGVEAAYAVAKGIIQDALALYVESNIGSGSGDESVITAANYDVDDIADMTKKLQDKGVSGSVSAIHNLSYAAALKKDAALQDASAYGNNQLISTGMLPPVLGVTPYYTDAFPSAVTSENTGVIFTDKSTAAIAIGAAGSPTGQENEAGVREQIITDSDTGLSLTWRTWVNSATGTHWGSVYAMYGVAYVRDGAVRVVSA